VVLVAVVSQLAVPALVSDGIEDRLTQGGGRATAEVEAFPSARLLFGDGDRLEVRGEGLDLELEVGENDGLSELDGFDEVDMRLESFRTGPIEVDSFELARSGTQPYTLRMSGSSTASALAQVGAAALDAGALGELGAAFFGGALGAAAVPLDLDLRLRSDDGTARVVGGQATAAGFDVTPLAGVIASTVAIKV